MSTALWKLCLSRLEDDLSAQQFNTWIRPLQVDGDQAEIRLYAPNRFVLDWVNDKYLNRIQELLDDLSQGQAPMVSLLIGSRRAAPAAVPAAQVAPAAAPRPIDPTPAAAPCQPPR